MSIPRTSPRRHLMRRVRWFAALAGLLAAATVWAPTAVAAKTPVPATGRAVPAAATDAAAPQDGQSAPASSVTLSPGDPIYSSGYRCTLGFNVTDGNAVYILTAGHCTSTGSYWYADAEGTMPIGPTAGSSFPGNDYGLIRYDNPDVMPAGGYTAADPYVGEQVYTVTPGTGIHSGVVTGLNRTVNYGGVIVYGLIETNMCLGGGVSGAPLIDGDRALGIGSGASGSCASGGASYFQPVTEALSATGVTLY